MRQQVTAIAMATAIFTGMSAAWAQQADSSRPPAQAELEQQMQRRRDAISNFENTLERAVSTGARNLSDKLSRVSGTAGVSGSFDGLLLSTPSAYGVPIPDYGLVFTVRVPGMNGTMVWAWAQTVRAKQLGPNVPVGLSTPTPVPPPISPTDAALLTDPNAWSAAYRDAIKDALLDAMLEDSIALRLGENESLTVAARREGRANPLDPSDRIKTVTFTVKGSVLEALRMKKLDLSAARKEVGVIED